MVQREDDIPVGLFSKGKLLKLTSKKYRHRYGYYLLEGSAAVLDAASQIGSMFRVVISKRNELRDADRKVLEELKNRGILSIELEPAEYKRLSDLKTPPPIIAVMNIGEAKEPTLPAEPGLVLALDQVADPGNVGTLIRAAAFYGVKEVWLGEGSADLYNPKVLRAAMSSHLHLKICQPVDLGKTFEAAKKQGAKLYAAVVEGETAQVMKELREPTILLLGNEPHGIRDEYIQMADHRVTIQRIGQVDSLNVAMAGTVLLDRYLSQSMGA